jgi:hypothetical protein
MDNSNHPAELVPFGEILSLLGQNLNAVIVRSATRAPLRDKLRNLPVAARRHRLREAHIWAKSPEPSTIPVMPVVYAK